MQERKKTIDKKILESFLKGKGSDKEKDLIRQWLDDKRMEHEIYEESLSFWDGISTDRDIKGYTGDNILDRIHHLLRIEEAELRNKTGAKVSFINTLSRIAAVLFIPLLVASLIFWSRNRSFRETVSWAEIHSPYGARTDFSLPDGSTGRLNGGSSLKFPVRFTGRVRDVKLEGEGYFDVISNNKKPFIVSTEYIDIKATGTSFNVMAYPDEQSTEVTLKSGRIEVSGKRSGSTRTMGILKPDEVLIYDPQSDSTRILNANIRDKLSWLDGKLVFKYEPFEQVVRKINRWYNVDIVIRDKKLDGYIYYGTFQDETLDEVLKLLQYTAPIKYKDLEREKRQDGTYEKRKIEIYGKK